MSDDYLWDKSGEPDPEVVALEKALAPLRHEDSMRAAAAEPLQKNASGPDRPTNVVQLAPRRAARKWAYFAGAAAIAASVLIAVWSLREPERVVAPQPSPIPSASNALPRPADPCASGSGFAFQATDKVSCDGVYTASGKLPVGVWLETASSGVVRVEVADIGAITLRANSRMRIVRSSASEHRIELVRGSLHAKVKAPPRLFVIDTRAATAVDLGCEYELSVDDSGRTHLHVLTGVVSLEGKGRAAYVPQRARIVADPEGGPGPVISDNADVAFKTAVSNLKQDDRASLAAALGAAKKVDSITLWNLLANGSSEIRSDVVKRMVELALVPKSVSPKSLIDGDAKAMEALRENLENDWFAESPPEPSPTPQRNAPAAPSGSAPPIQPGNAPAAQPVTHW
ncbi:MAG: FecR domain-containing protein [Polyangiaceae bacterium]|nr:FecR domain-containing protein [Polyangiaceae bacterium]